MTKRFSGLEKLREVIRGLAGDYARARKSRFNKKMESVEPLLLPVRLRMTHGLSAATIRDLKYLRDGIQLALAHAQASKDKEKFILPLKEYRRAVDLVLTVGRLDVNA